MKIGEITEVKGVKYIAQEEVVSCRGCYFDNQAEIDCYKDFECKVQDDIILVKIPVELLEKIEQLEKQIELMMNCENCNGNSSLTCSGCKNYSNWNMKK